MADRGVVLDATFRNQEDLTAARGGATASGAQFRLIECQLAPEQVRARLEKRTAKAEGLSDATWETYLRQRAETPELKIETGTAHLILDTSGDLSATARNAADWLRTQE